jgi:hypothetical protein
MKNIPILSVMTFAGLLAGGGLAVPLLLRQQAEIKTLRTQLTARQSDLEAVGAQLAMRLTNRSELRAATPEVIPPSSDPNAFAGVVENTVPGRYKWIQSEQDKGILTLFPDHTFENHKGQKFAAYRWQLARDRLVLEWNIGSIHFTSIAAPGVYVGLRTDGQTERMEKVE